MNGMTGLNPEVAKLNIDRFAIDSFNVEEKIGELFRGLFIDLRATWASKNAVDFYNKYSAAVTEDMNAFVNAICAVRENATRAYNIVAKANGASTIGNDFAADGVSQFPTFGTNMVLFGDISFQEATSAGVTGMNVKMVQNFIIPSYQSSLTNAISEIGEIPSAIALYDDENGQQVAFENNISSMKAKFETLISELFSELKGYLETEVETILLAKQDSQNTLSGNA